MCEGLVDGLKMRYNDKIIGMILSSMGKAFLGMVLQRHIVERLMTPRDLMEMEKSK